MLPDDFMPVRLRRCQRTAAGYGLRIDEWSLRVKSHDRTERDAWVRWWLSPEELDHYGIRDSPERWGDYLAFDAWSRVVRRPLSDANTAALAENKWLFEHYFRGQGFALPRMYGLVHPLQGRMIDGVPVRRIEDLLEWLRDSEIDNFVVKPVVGWNSEGLVICTGVDWSGNSPVFESPEGELSQAMFEKRVSLSFRGTVGCVVQERCRPDPVLDQLGLGLPNSVRIVVFMPDGGVPEVQAAVLFVGRHGQMVNSWTKGAVSIPIDVETGQLGAGRTLPSFGVEPLSRHPDTGKSFLGQKLPRWSEAGGLAIDASLATPNLRLVCWEILLTAEGPRLLEANLGFGLTMLQVHTAGFLKDGTAERWRQGGVSLPDGSPYWGRPRLPGRLYRKAKRVAARVAGRA